MPAIVLLNPENAGSVIAEIVKNKIFRMVQK